MAASLPLEDTGAREMGVGQSGPAGDFAGPGARPRSVCPLHGTTAMARKDCQVLGVTT